MPSEVLPSGSLKRETLVAFLLSAFGLKAGAPFVDEDLLRWKYDQPRPDWNGPRSYVLNDTGGRITAHACLCPVTFLISGAEVTSSYLIDWGADRTSAGAGVLLLRKLAKHAQTLLAIGGSPQTQEILPKLGYRRCGDLDFYVRVVRPWSQFRTDPFPRGWKAPLRLLRNTAWSLTPLARAPEQWSATPILKFEESARPVLESRMSADFTSTKRDAALMNYLLGCPGAVFSPFLVFSKGVLRGWFVLTRVGGQGRIADIWVNSGNPIDWQAAYSLATRAAEAHPAICEIVAAASIAPAREALVRNGFRKRDSQPIFLYDPNRMLEEAPALNINLIESDAAYLHDPSYPYLT